MYYPQSKVITNLYTNGNEFILKDSNSLYVGFYHKLYDGSFFSGKNPTDYPVIELVESKNIVISNNIIENIDINGENDVDVYNYTELKQINSSLSKIIPSSYYPKPNIDDYNVGEFQRYFVKKVNDNIFIEIDKNAYNGIISRNSKYAYEFYIPFKTSWLIYGNKIDVYNINKNNITYIEKTLNIVGLKEYLKNNYTKYYKYPIIDGLKTKGNQLQFYNKKEYVGLYNIDETKGFIVKNSNGINTLLYPLNEDIEKQLLNEALKSIGKFTYPYNIYDSLKKKNLE